MKEKVYANHILKFLENCVSYCRLLEEPFAKFESKQLMVEISKQLASLYASCLSLPDFEAQEEIDLEEFVTENDYHYIHNRLVEKFDTDNDYLDLVDPLMLEYQEPIGTSLAEYLTDIYQVLKNYSTHYQMRSNDQVLLLANAQLQEEYRTYWGGRLVSALRAMNLIINRG